MIGIMVTDGRGEAIPAFVADPLKSQIPTDMTLAGPGGVPGVRTFARAPGAGVDYVIAGWIAVKITPFTTSLLRCFNEDAAKTCTVFSGKENIIYLHPSVQSLTILGTDSSTEIEGM